MGSNPAAPTIFPASRRYVLPMVTVLVRFTALGLGLVFAWLAIASWRSGEPPGWTLVLPTEPARVIHSAVRTGLIANGTERSIPVVTVEWPLGSGDEVELAGLLPSFFAYRREEAAAIAAEFGAGAAIGVRVHEGRAYADRVDLFGLVHAAAMSALAVLLLIVGAIMAIAGRDRSSARKLV